MPRDQVGRRIRPHAAAKLKTPPNPRRDLYLRIGAGGLAVLAAVLSIVAAQSK